MYYLWKLLMMCVPSNDIKITKNTKEEIDDIKILYNEQSV